MPLVEGAKKLNRFIEKRGVTRAALARAVSVSRPTVTNWLRGTIRPGPVLRQAIAKWTDNVVEPEDWYTPGERAELERLGKVEPYRAN